MNKQSVLLIILCLPMLMSDYFSHEEVCASMSTAHGSAISLATAGSFQTFKVISRDSNTFSIQSRNDQFVAFLQGNPTTFLSYVISKAESNVRYKVPEAGKSLLDVRTLKCRMCLNYLGLSDGVFAGGRLWATFYDDSFRHVVGSRLFDFETACKQRTVPGSVRLQGFLRNFESTEYIFTASDGSMLYLDGRLIIPPASCQGNGCNQGYFRVNQNFILIYFLVVTFFPDARLEVLYFSFLLSKY